MHKILASRFEHGSNRRKKLNLFQTPQIQIQIESFKGCFTCSRLIKSNSRRRGPKLFVSLYVLLFASQPSRSGLHSLSLSLSLQLSQSVRHTVHPGAFFPLTVVLPSVVEQKQDIVGLFFWHPENSFFYGTLIFRHWPR